MSTPSPEEKMPGAKQPTGPAQYQEIQDELVLPYKAAAFYLTAMFGCVAAGAITCAMAGWTEWQPGLLLPLLILTFVFGFYRWVWLHERLQVQDKNYSWAISLSEFIILLIVARVAAYIVDSGQFASDLGNIPSNPLRLFSGQFVYYFLSMIFSWYLARQGARNVGKLYLHPRDMLANNDIRDMMLFDGDRRDAYIAINSGWRWGVGAIAVMTIFGLFYNNQTINVGPLELRSQMLILFTLYFVIGVLWNAWGRLRYLRTTWQSRKIAEPPQLVSRWSRYLIILIVLAAIPAILIPGGYSLNPLVWLDWLLSLFKTGTQGRPSIAGLDQRRPITPLPIPTPSPPPPPSSPPLLDLSWLPLVLFWVVTIFLLIYALRILAQTGLGRFKLPSFFLTRWLSMGWNYILSFFRVKLQFSLKAAENEEEMINEDARGGIFDFLRPERAPQDPRARVRYYYKKLLRKGAKAGLGRSKGMASQEYAGYLQKEVADPVAINPDLDNLTSHFQEARYSRHPISEEQAQQAEQNWRRLEPNIKKPEPPPLENK